MNRETRDIIQETARKTVEELMKNGMIAQRTRSPYQKTETLLYNYNSFKEALKSRDEQIEEIRSEGVRKHSTSIIPMPENTGKDYIMSDEEKADMQIAQIESSIAVTRRYVGMIDSILDEMKDDRWFDIIPMRYFEGMKIEDIADRFGCDTREIGRQKSRLIERMQVKLFSDDVIEYILLS